MAKKSWGYSPKKQPAPKVPAGQKQTIKDKADEIVKTVLIPQYVKPPPENYQLNYVVDIYTKWYRHYFYFCSTYHAPSPHAISPSFDVKFARLEYVATDKFNLAYMRHTKKWQEIAYNISLDEAFEMITEEPFFHP